MKAIMLSIRPKWVAKILNGDKTIEIRKKFPKDYRGWVYIYCTKSRPNLYRHFTGKYIHLATEYTSCLNNGKVVAMFYCDKVEINKADGSCVSWGDIMEYTNGNNFYGIHISKLEIFHQVKELSDFNIKKAPQNYMYI